MKQLLFTMAIIATFTFSSCEKEIVGCMDPKAENYNPEANTPSNNCTYKTGCTNPTAVNYDPTAVQDDGSCQYQGKASFWMNESGDIKVWINNVFRGTVVDWFDPYSPNCGQNGTLTVTLPVGSHSYYAESFLFTWNGTVNVTANGCTLMLLD